MEPLAILTEPVTPFRSGTGLGVAGAVCATLGLLGFNAGPILPGFVLAFLFVGGLLAPALVLAGLRRLRAAGPGLGRHALTGWMLGYALLLAYAVLGMAGFSIDGLRAVVIPLALLLLLACGAGSAVGIARAGVLTGWRRWAPLALAVAQLELMLPLSALPTPAIVVLRPLAVIAAGIALVAPVSPKIPSVG